MRVMYVYHSCFLAETEKSYYLFDYFQGKLPPLKSEKPIVVLASHSHHDHYNPAVFSMLQKMGMQQILPVLSSDIPPETRPAELPCRVVSPGERCRLPQGQVLTTYRSTDLGAAFLIQDGDDWFYHAGDLNDWVWEGEPEEDNRRMTQAYRPRIFRAKPCRQPSWCWIPGKRNTTIEDFSIFSSTFPAKTSIPCTTGNTLRSSADSCQNIPSTAAGLQLQKKTKFRRIVYEI